MDNIIVCVKINSFSSKFVKWGEVTGPPTFNFIFKEENVKIFFSWEVEEEGGLIFKGDLFRESGCTMLPLLKKKL